MSNMAGEGGKPWKWDMGTTREPGDQSHAQASQAREGIVMGMARGGDE